MKTFIFTCCALFMMIISCGSHTGSIFNNFISASNGRLYDGHQEYRFISFNIPNLHYIEDNLPFEETNPWRLPDSFEIADALTSIQQMGGKVARTYTLSVRKKEDGPFVPRHVLAPGQFNEEAFRALDRVLQLANEIGVRLIIPFVDNWSWWGGTAEYAAFRNKPQKAFWTDPQIIDDFEKTIEYVLNRSNVYTGIKYKDDKAVLAWETGNELQSPPEWTRKIAAFVKSLDTNHLLIDGFHSNLIRDESLAMPDIDIVTTHHYPRNAQEMIQRVRANQEKARGVKPYLIGEFGFVSTKDVEHLLDTVIGEGVSGALIWSLRFHNRDGGFYWHSEPFGGDLFKAYHWPGFREGAAYDEINLLHLMRQKAFEIRGLVSPAIPIPLPPTLLPIANVSAISWQGSAGALSYIVERADESDGQWRVIANDISDAAVQYRPLFNDESAEIGHSYFYRVRAKNRAGVSPPSNIIGPVHVKHLTLVDEMKDFSRIYRKQGTWTLQTREARKAKEDIHRLAGLSGSSIVYRVPGNIKRILLQTFFPKSMSEPRLAVAGDDKKFQHVVAQKTEFFTAEEAYGYWKPVEFTSTDIPDGAAFVKIFLTTETQISRIEIQYAK